jgi:CheY-like chemotaxis protein
MHHILLVDDDLNFRRSLVIQLEFEGFSVTEVERASQAITFLEQHHTLENFPDIVITDVRMPEMDGREFVTLLKQKFATLPVIVISAFDLPEELTGYAFLRKPFKIQEMLEMVNTLIK